jgi:hypothetical protein
MEMQMQMQQFDDDDDDIPWKPKATTEEICNPGIDVVRKMQTPYPQKLQQCKSESVQFDALKTPNEPSSSSSVSLPWLDSFVK